MNNNGDIYLVKGGTNFIVAPYYIDGGANDANGYSRSSTWLYRIETNTTQLRKLGSTLLQNKKSTFRDISDTFVATKALIVTWYKYLKASDTTKSNSLQVALVTDGFYSYFVFLYERLQVNGTTPTSGFATPAGYTGWSVWASVTDSNCNVPGQFVFRVDGRGGNINFIISNFFFSTDSQTYS
jgi:hypothetical protein